MCGTRQTRLQSLSVIKPQKYINPKCRTPTCQIAIPPGRELKWKAITPQRFLYNFDFPFLRLFCFMCPWNDSSSNQYYTVANSEQGSEPGSLAWKSKTLHITPMKCQGSSYSSWCLAKLRQLCNFKNITIHSLQNSQHTKWVPSGSYYHISTMQNPYVSMCIVRMEF